MSERTKMIASLLNNELAAKMKTTNLPWSMCLITPKALGEIADMRLDGTLSSKGAREIIDIMWDAALENIKSQVSQFPDTSAHAEAADMIANSLRLDHSTPT